jgi:hypothetical protein
MSRRFGQPCLMSPNERVLPETRLSIERRNDLVVPLRGKRKNEKKMKKERKRKKETEKNAVLQVAETG